MINKDTLIKVLNRDNGSTIYSIPEMNGLRRVFQAGEVKETTFEQLQKLSYIPGGLELLRNNLVILNNEEAIKELMGQVEPQYSYTEKDIQKLMREGSLDAFLDCLDFAPQGVKEIIKHLAVTMPLNDVSKREAILDKLGFNVDNAIRIKKQSEEDSLEKNNTITHRRVQKTEEKPSMPTTTRRIITKKE